MANKVVTKQELLERWRCIEEEEEEENADDDVDVVDLDPSKHRRIHLHKEQWFVPSLFHILLLCLNPI